MVKKHMSYIMPIKPKRMPNSIIQILKKKLKTIIFALEKFRSYLVGTSDHISLKYPLTKKEPRLVKWILLLQKFDLVIRKRRRVKI